MRVIEKVLETNPFITMTVNYTYKKAVNVIDHNHDKVHPFRMVR
jgi:hypothetical protein